jgi:1-acyl-sn-glycerol-3-phosphate acyltransferase
MLPSALSQENLRRWSLELRLAWLLYPFRVGAMVIATLILAPLVILLAMLRQPEWAYSMVAAWCRALTTLFRVRYTIRGLENLPRSGSYVIIANHRSHLDGPTLILALPHRFFFVIKRELARMPLWGQAVVRLGYIPIDRGRSEQARAQMQQAVATVRRGRRILVFAEGTRSRSESMLPFKKGGFHLAVDAQVPIVPIAINHSRAVLPKGAFCPVPGVIEYVVGEPIPTAGLDKSDVGALLEQTQETIESMRSW